MLFVAGAVDGSPTSSLPTGSPWASSHKIIKVSPKGSVMEVSVQQILSCAGRYRGLRSKGSARPPCRFLSCLGWSRAGVWNCQPPACLLLNPPAMPTAKSEESSQPQSFLFSQAPVPHSHFQFGIDKKKTSTTLLLSSPPPSPCDMIYKSRSALQRKSSSRKKGVAFF